MHSLRMVAIVASLTMTSAYTRLPASRMALTRASSAPRGCHIQAGLFDSLFGSEEERARREAEKEEAWRAQQAILDRRRESGGLISDEDEAAIMARRLAVVDEGQRELERLQNRGDGSDRLEEWKELRDSGKVKTATKGLERDADSSRLGSEGLFAERIDTKLPYVDNGYVAEDADVMGKLSRGFGSLFGGGGKSNKASDDEGKAASDE